MMTLGITVMWFAVRIPLMPQGVEHWQACPTVLDAPM